MTVPAMAGDFPQISTGHGLRTFAGASHSCLTGMPTHARSLLPGWSTHRRHHTEAGAWLGVLNEDRRVLANKVKGRIWSSFGDPAANR